MIDLKSANKLAPNDPRIVKEIATVKVLDFSFELRFLVVTAVLLETF